MESKTIVIVGGTDGIGRALANLLVPKNQVLIIGRSEEKGKRFVAESGKNAHYLTADLSVLNNLPPLVDKIKSLYSEVHHIIHTADILRIKRMETVEGIEISIAINFYSRVLFNQLMVGEANTYQPERIIHVAAAGFGPSEKFLDNFPLPPTANSFDAHKNGQIANDFYGLLMQRKLSGQGTKINILNPGSVSTDIHKKGELPKLLKIFYPLIGRLLIGKRRSPEDYAHIPFNILKNENSEANNFTLINPKGKGIKGNKQVNNITTQEKLYEFAKGKINDTLNNRKIKNWL
ncbi:MAG: SDR family NAD(P)-dependent oxidoreductase [Thermonemataceae bacterium]